MSKEQVFKITEAIYNEVSKSITACNIKGADKENELNAPLALAAQMKCDSLLKNTKQSVLERILLCAKAVRHFTAGNCMLQAFVIFADALQQLKKADLITINSCIPMYICTSSNHTFVQIDELVCDPWGNYLGQFKGSVYEKYAAEIYFGISADWQCWNDNQRDESSTSFTYSLFKKKPPVLTHFFKPHVRPALKEVTNSQGQSVSTSQGV